MQEAVYSFFSLHIIPCNLHRVFTTLFLLRLLLLLDRLPAQESGLHIQAPP